MYKCSAKCCETSDTIQDVQSCVENCSRSFSRAQGIIGQELEAYQVYPIGLACFSFHVPGTFALYQLSGGFNVEGLLGHLRCGPSPKRNFCSI